MSGANRTSAIEKKALEYTLPVELDCADVPAQLVARLVDDVDDSGHRVWRLACDPQIGEAAAMELPCVPVHSYASLLAPADSCVYQFATQWIERLPGVEMTVTKMNTIDPITQPTQVEL